METNRDEIAVWLKPFADALYSWYAYEDVPPYELRIAEPGALGGSIGMYSYDPSRGVPSVIEVSAGLVADIWEAEAAERTLPGYRLRFFDTVLHKSRRCDCHDSSLCAAWVALIDVLKHELTHHYCLEHFHKDEGARSYKCRRHGWHCVHFLWYAVRMRLELGGVFSESGETRLLKEKIVRRYKPEPHIVGAVLTVAPGRVKSVMHWSPEASKPVAIRPAEPARPIEATLEDEDEYELWIGIGA